MFVARHLMVWALLPWAPAAWAQQGGDYQAQILYAYQTEDTNGLANLIQDLTTRVKEDAGDASLRYHLAHAEYRRGLLAGTAQLQRAFAQLQLAVQLFDASSATSIDTPGWGHAEAYLALGRELQARGDQLGARNWIEKSLIAAPEYKAAQRQLALLVRH